MKTMKKCTFLLICVIIEIAGVSICCAQTRAIDSMRTLLQTQQSDTDRINTLNTISVALHTSKPEETEIYARKAVALAQRVGFRRGLAEAYRLIGLSMWARSRPMEALEALTLSLNIFREIGNNSGMGEVYNLFALVYSLQGNYAQAQLFYFQSLAKAEESGDEFGKTIALSNIGELYERQNNLSKANELYQKALPLAKQFNRFMLSRVLLNLGSVTYKLGKPNEALAFLQQAVEAAEGANDKQDLTLVLRTIGIIERSNDPAKALSTLFHALAIAEDIPDNRSISLNCVALSETYLVMGNTTQALAFARRALGTARKFGLKLEIKLSAEALTSAYEDVGDSKNALASYKMAMAYKDSLFNDESAQRIAGVEYDYKLEKQQAEAQALRNEQANQRKILFGVVAALILMAGLLVLTLYSNAQRKRANALLTSQKAVIEKQSEQIQLTNTKLQEYNLELDISLQNLTTLSTIGQRITATLDIESVFSKLHEAVQHILDAPIFTVGVMNETQQEIEVLYGIESNERMPIIRYALHETNRLAVQCALRRKEIILNNLQEEYIQFTPQRLAPKFGRQTCSVLYFPLIVESRLIGVLSVQSFRTNAYAENQIEMMRALVSYTAIALDNSIVYSKLEKVLQREHETQQQLLKAEKMASLGTLVAGVAHELNTPIGVAVTAASTLHVRTQDFAKRYTEGALKKSELESYVQTAQTGADLTLRNLERAANLIQSFKQVSVDQTYDNIRRFGVKQYLHEIITSLQPKWKTTGHRVEIECDEALEMETYAGAIAQIITNFVTNSLLHGFDGYTEEGVIRIEAERVGSNVVIKYSDNGRGIPPEVLPRIFDPFFTTKQANGGTGLGMHIVYNLVTQKLGGTIQAESHFGSGVHFHIQLPNTIFPSPLSQVQ